MFYQILIAILVGCCAGIITGLIPGIHINLVSIILLNVSGYLLGFTEPISLCVFIICMSVTHSFLDTIPSVFLGAPDADTALGVLPGHKMLLEGKGFEAVKLTVIGSLLCLILSIVILPGLIPIVPVLYNWIKPFIGYILIFVVVYMVVRAGSFKQACWSFVVFAVSGVLGLIVLNIANIDQPLLPMLSGLFGLSTLLTSLNENVNIPEQKITETITVSKKNTWKALGAGTFSGTLTSFFPGLGAAQAAIIGSQLTGNIGNYGFMILIGGINTVNFLLSLVTLYTLQKARNGAVIVVLEIIKSIDLNGLIVFIASALVAGGIATFLALIITRGFAKLMSKVDYKKMVLSVIIFIIGIVFYFSGFIGLVILMVSTALGMIAPMTNTGRNMSMGCLLLPVILYFV